MIVPLVKNTTVIELLNKYKYLACTLVSSNSLYGNSVIIKVKVKLKLPSVQAIKVYTGVYVIYANS
jgi:hypothetical protein